MSNLPKLPELVRDARALSSGTLSYLVDDTRYTVVDQVQADFVEFCEENQHYPDWKQAWADFIKIYNLNQVKGEQDGKI